jgi:hypothetical protein
LLIAALWADTVAVWDVDGARYFRRRQKGKAGKRQTIATNALNQKKSCQAAVLASAKRRSLISAMDLVGINAAISPDHCSACCKLLSAPANPKESSGIRGIDGKGDEAQAQDRGGKPALADTELR